MDYIRTAGFQRVRLWEDSDEWTLIRWFRADPDAQGFPAPHRYPHPSMLNDDTDPRPLPEHMGPVIGYDPGSNFCGYLGDRFCGSLQAFRDGGIHGIDPEIATDVDGIAECCRPPDRDGTGRLAWHGPAKEPEATGRTLLFAGSPEETTVPSEPFLVSTELLNPGTIEPAAGEYIVVEHVRVQLQYQSAPPVEWFVWLREGSTDNVWMTGGFTRDWDAEVWDGRLYLPPGWTIWASNSSVVGEAIWFTISGTRYFP